MPIVAADLEVHLSGGTSNSDPTASIGGAISNTEVNTGTTLHNIFDKITGDESEAGDTEYRILYLKNGHATLTGERAKIYFASNYLDQISIAVSEAKNTNAQTLTDESTEPTGSLTWTQPTTQSAAVLLGDLDADDDRAFYLRRVIGMGAAAKNAAEFQLKVEIDSPE